MTLNTEHNSKVRAKPPSHTNRRRTVHIVKECLARRTKWFRTDYKEKKNGGGSNTNFVGWLCEFEIRRRGDY